MFIVATHMETGNMLRINTDHVAYFGPFEEGTIVVFSNGDQIKLVESADTIFDSLFRDNI